MYTYLRIKNDYKFSSNIKLEKLMTVAAVYSE